MSRRRRRVAKRRQYDDSGMLISSMIDIVFLLLIYFIATQAPTIEDTLLGVNLPEPSNSHPSKPLQIINIDVVSATDDVSDSMYFFNGKSYHLTELQNIFCEVASFDPDMKVMIGCGPNAKHKKLIHLLNACAEAGLNKINVVNIDTIRFKAQ